LFACLLLGCSVRQACCLCCAELLLQGQLRMLIGLRCCFDDLQPMMLL
jgi:hypothetical protein